MPNLAAAAKLAIDQAIRSTRVSATVYRGAETALLDAAGLGAFSATAVGEDGEPIRVSEVDARDLIVRPTDWLLSTAPESGDRFKVDLPNGSTAWFECSAFPPEPAVRWSDRFETAYRIHLKKIDAPA